MILLYFFFECHMYYFLHDNIIKIIYNHNYVYIVGDGRLGYPDRGPYDAIHVGAAAKEMPRAVRKKFFYIKFYF